MEHPSVDRAAVAAHELAASGRTLVAYVVRSLRASLPATADLRDFLRSRLPEHMVPQFYEWVPALPLLPSGKIDRGALKAPSLERIAAPPAAADLIMTPT